MFHQVAYSVDYDFYRVENNTDFSFPAHAHACFEVLFITSGQMEVTVGAQTRLLRAGDAALIFPNQIHSLKTPWGCSSSHTLCIFSHTLVRHFYTAHQKTIPEDSFYHADSAFVPLVQRLSEETNISTVKGTLYLVCGQFESQSRFLSCSTMDANSSSLISQIFTFIERNAQGDCSLTRMAKEMPYSYVHLSRFFKQTCGITFVEYVNHFRISEACYLLQNTKKTITDICAESGYSSMRSFNRNFKEVTGLTPYEYRKKAGTGQAAQGL